MDTATSNTSDVAMVDTLASVFPFLELPRELRDQIYNHAFAIPDPRGDRALRIERRHLKYFAPSAATILLILHHEYLLLNRQIARESLQVLFKHHTVFLSCGPFVLKTLLKRIEGKGGPCKQWLKWLKRIELDWVTFPNLQCYPPERGDERDEWWWEQDDVEVDVDYIRGAQYSGHYDEHDYEGGYYDDNFYDPSDTSLYPSFPQPAAQAPNPNDPFGFSSHYPFTHPSRERDYDTSAQEDLCTKLELLVSMEVTPLFDYLRTPTFSISSITLPLYFISKSAHHNRSITRPGYALPVKIRYWVQMLIHALLMLGTPPSTGASSTVREVRVKYMPWDIWASMEPVDNLNRMAEKGIFFNETTDMHGREGEGEAFRATWAGLRERGYCRGKERMGLEQEVKFVKWEGDLDKWRVGDELEVIFTKN